MAKSVLPAGVQEVTFKGIKLFARMVEWTDTRKPRLASHTYLKRDGGQVERMGREQARVKMTLVYVGEKFVDQFAELSNAVDKDPKGELVHPLYGSMNVACEGFDGATLNTENAVNLYTVPVSFIEDNVDATTAIKTTGTASQAQEAESRSARLIANSTQYVAAAQAIQNFANAALSFSVSAFSSIADATLDSSLGPQLEELVNITEDTVAEIWADPFSDPQAASFDMVSDCELLLDACNQLYASISIAKPPLVSYVMPMQMHIASLCTKLYGSLGKSKIDEVLSLNRGKIPNPGAIRAGITLQVPQPTEF
jgi:hypothetical protein